MYEVRVMNLKTGKVECRVVDVEELKALYRSIWYDIFDVVPVN